MRATRKQTVGVYDPEETGRGYQATLGQLYDEYRARMVAQGRLFFAFAEWARVGCWTK